MSRTRIATTAALVAALAGGCAGPLPPAAPPISTTAAVPRTIAPGYAPVIDPAGFTTTIDNPYFPLVPGTRFVYEATTADGTERIVVDVTRETRIVMGVPTVVVHDVATVDGQVEEDTFDWYAQDTDGNVWYFGEATSAGGDTSGSFEAGVDGAQPGLVMPVAPAVGDHYRQEYYAGEAEDTGKVLYLAGTETARYGGTYRDLLVTEDVNPLDPAAAVEHKFYARGVGLVVAVHVTGPAERLELVAVEHF